MTRSSLKICVAVPTYRRPKSLERLLTAFYNLKSPEAGRVSFLVVDNDPKGSAKSLVEGFSSRHPHLNLSYVVESQAGIPSVRNRAFDEALKSGSDILCFTDDDAWPEAEWLVHLLECYQKTRSVLIFGPQRLYGPPNLESLWKVFIARSLEARSRFVERFCEKQSQRGRIATSGTYNWLGDLHWIKKNRLRFNPAMQFSGGSDTAFREAVRKKGGLMTWCPQAIVCEEIPEARLSLRYQFYRARMQGMTSAHFNRPIFPVMLRSPMGRILIGSALILFPALGMASFSLGLHQVGMGVGILQARRGRQADLYIR